MIGVYPIGVPADFIPVHYALALQRCSQFDEYLCSFERQSSQIQCIECSVVATFAVIVQNPYSGLCSIVVTVQAMSLARASVDLLRAGTLSDGNFRCVHKCSFAALGGDTFG